MVTGTSGHLEAVFGNSFLTHHARAERSLHAKHLLFQGRPWDSGEEHCLTWVLPSEGSLHLDSCPFPSSPVPSSSRQADYKTVLRTNPTLSADQFYKLTWDMCTFGVRRAAELRFQSSHCLAGSSHFSFLCLLPLLLRRR